MKTYGRIITVGVSPAWDIRCIGTEIDWGAHAQVDFKSITAAGKAMNVSKALAGLKCKSIAAGLWGNDDIAQLRESMKDYKKFITVKMTEAPGTTRSNYWIINPRLKKEMHIRNKSELESPFSIAQLQKNLKRLIHEKDIVVFSGAMSKKSVSLVKSSAAISPYIVLDTSGKVLKQLVHSKKIWLIKPNFQEFCELIGKKITNTPQDIFTAAKGLLKFCPNLLISRGSRGAVFVNKDLTLVSELKVKRKAQATVGCGDFALAGFIAGLVKGLTFENSLNLSIKTGTARAFEMQKQ